MNFIVLFMISVAPSVLLVVAWVMLRLERRRYLPPPQIGLYARFVEDDRICSRERAEHAARQRDLVLWNAQFRPSDDKPVFARESRESRKERLAFREYVHVDPLTDENVVKCGLMKKVVLPS
jgi:hypothetical protein